MFKYLNKSFFINLFIILSIFGLDRFTKVYVISENDKNLSSELFVSKFCFVIFFIFRVPNFTSNSAFILDSNVDFDSKYKFNME